MHYKDGTEAKVGDLVKGTTYNTPKGSVQVGVMLGITAGSSACNCRVGIVQVRPVGDLVLPFGRPAGSQGPDDKGSPHVMALRTGEGDFQLHHEGVVFADGKQTAGSTVLFGAKVDYSQCDHLELVHRPEA